MPIHEKAVTAFIGPRDVANRPCLRCFNRLNDLIEGVKEKGDDSLSRQGHPFLQHLSLAE
jgi:ABC-type phosphate transport system ATPase subunit